MTKAVLLFVGFVILMMLSVALGKKLDERENK